MFIHSNALDADEGRSVLFYTETATLGRKKMKRVHIHLLPEARIWAFCWIFALIGTLLILRPPAAFADMVLSERTEMVGGFPMQGQNASGQQTRESTTYLQGKRIRTETEEHVWVLDFEKGKLITLNPKAKTYTEMSLEDLKEAQKQAMEWMKNLRSQMEAKMKTMPPESREAMKKKLDSLPEGMFGEEAPTKITVKATGKQETINGYACREYEVYEDGELTTRYWLAPSVSTQVFDEYQKELSEWLEGMGPLGANRLREWEYIRDKGFPIKVKRVKPIAGKVSFNREILRVEEKSLTADLFRPPKDYKRTEAPAIPKLGAKPGATPPSPTGTMPPPK
jgi:hypothetical protein